ncbi:MAG: fatty acyl-AMP ligase [Deltaproteobacteria bacterium]|nr:MAG: fatty acyl-AMP ligase [Deltaproteobacteria bacterium]
MGAWLHHAADHAPPGHGLRFLDRRERPTLLDWAEVHRRARAAAGTLQRKGVQAGDRVAIILPTAPSFTDAFFGCQLLGAVPVALYPPVRLGRLEAYHAQTAGMLRCAKARLLITEPRIHRLLGQTLARFSPSLGTLDATTLSQGPTASITTSHPHDLAMIQFSSGTTRDPKPVGLTHAQVLAQTFALIDEVLSTGPASSRAGVSWLPLYHDMGLIGCIFPALCLGASLTLLPPELFLARPAAWLRAISDYQGTVSPAPDFAYRLCVQRISEAELDGLDLSSWSLALNGAEPVRPSTLRAFSERFGRCGLRATALTPVYGLSEAALAVTFSEAAAPPRILTCDPDALAEGRVVPGPEGVEIVSVGRPVPGFSLEVRDPHGEVLPPRRVGKLWARGPSIMEGYLDRDDQPLEDGWLDTGDLGFVHDGELYIAGRAKDVLILRGRNHAPHLVENAVDEVEGVRQGCAVAVSDVLEDGEVLLVFVEVRAPHPDQAQACAEAIRAATGLRPDAILLLEPGTLPRTSSGKLRRAETLRRYRRDELAPPQAITPWGLAKAFARSGLGRLGWIVEG